MSTKIYNGTKLPNMSLLELMKFLQGQKSRFEAAVQEEIDAKRVGLAIQEYDRRTLKVGDTKESIGLKVSHALEYQYEEKKWFTTKCELSLFPLQDKILAIFFGERPFEKMWSETPGVSFYGYWDNTDEDKNATPEEWEQRKKDWEEVLTGDGKSGIPGLEGLGYQFTSENLYMFIMNQISDDTFNRFLPNMKERAKDLAAHIIDSKVRVETNDVMAYLSSAQRKAKIRSKANQVINKLEVLTNIKDIFQKKW